MDPAAGGLDTLGSASALSSELSPDEPRPLTRRPLFVRAAWALAVISALAVAVPVVLIYNERASILNDLERRLGILARGRAEVMETWLDGLSHPLDKVADSEMFRLFATEIDLALGDVADLAAGKQAGTQEGLSVPLTAQIPFMSQVLTDFAKSEGYAAARLIDRQGVAFVTSAGALELSASQRGLAEVALKSGVLHYGPLRDTAQGLVLDIFAPVLSAQSGTGRGAPVGIAMISAPVGERLKQLLSPPLLTQAGEQLRLVQIVAGGPIQIAPRESPALRSVTGFDEAQTRPAASFAQRAGIAGGAVYSLGAPVAGPGWQIVQEIDAGTVQQRLGGYIAATVGAAVLIVLAVAAVFGAFWWRLTSEHNQALAEQFRHLAKRIEAQKRLLDSINNTITDHIVLKTLKGAYRYVNPAFAGAIGKDVEHAVGLDDVAIYGKGTAGRLKISDQRALTSGAAVTTGEEVYLGNKLHHLQITKVPYREGDGAFTGIVSVSRDVTELVEEQKRREQAIHQTVAALVRAVELRDPYLAGHSRRVAGFAVAVAKRMGASDDDITTVEIAADLSQIGKLGIPRAILNSPKRLSPKQIEQIQGHLAHAKEILRNIDFKLPVLDTIMAMHERLDGKGYPEGMKGDVIPLTARILGVCDVFCARLEPRSYRRGIAAKAAIEILETNAKRYDPEVVAALRGAAESITGEKLMADLKTA